MTFLQSPDRLSISDFAKRHKVKSADLWLPLHLAPTAHSHLDDPIVVRATSALALYNGADSSLVYRRAVIATALSLPSLETEETGVRLDAVPENCVVFIRWDRPGRKYIPANTPVLHRSLSLKDALEQGIVAATPAETRGRKRTASLSAAATEAGSLEDAQRRMTQKRTNNAMSRDDLEKRLTEATPSLHDSSEPAQLRLQTRGVIHGKRRLPPLHFVVAPAATVIASSPDTFWQRPDPRVIYRTFRPAGSTSRKPVSRKLLLVFLDDVLLRFFDFADLTSGRTGEPTEARLEARRAVFGDVLLQHVQRGYSACLVDHVPSLHHASKDEFQRVTAMIESLCTRHCSRVDVTVVLSVLSNLSATTGANASFVLPQSSGLVHFITSEVNQALPPDVTASLVVGTQHRNAQFAQDQHQQFASNAHMQFADIDSFLGLSQQGEPTV